MLPTQLRPSSCSLPLLAASALLALTGCVSDDGATTSGIGGSDAGTPPPIDAGSAVDAGADAGTDAGADAGTDAGADAGPDGGPICPPVEECGVDHTCRPDPHTRLCGVKYEGGSFDGVPPAWDSIWVKASTEVCCIYGDCPDTPQPAECDCFAATEDECGVTVDFADGYADGPGNGPDGDIHCHEISFVHFATADCACGDDDLDEDVDEDFDEAFEDCDEDIDEDMDDDVDEDIDEDRDDDVDEDCDEGSDEGRGPPPGRGRGRGH